MHKLYIYLISVILQFRPTTYCFIAFFFRNITNSVSPIKIYMLPKSLFLKEDWTPFFGFANEPYVLKENTPERLDIHSQRAIDLIFISIGQ